MLYLAFVGSKDENLSDVVNDILKSLASLGDGLGNENHVGFGLQGAFKDEV